MCCFEQQMGEAIRALERILLVEQNALRHRHLRSLQLAQGLLLTQVFQVEFVRLYLVASADDLVEGAIHILEEDLLVCDLLCLDVSLPLLFLILLLSDFAE